MDRYLIYDYKKKNRFNGHYKNHKRTKSYKRIGKTKALILLLIELKLLEEEYKKNITRTNFDSNNNVIMTGKLKF